MTAYTLNPRGEAYIEDYMRPYVDLEQVLSDMRIRLSDFSAKHGMELLKDAVLKTVYNALADGLIAAEDEMPDLEEMAQSKADNLLEEREYRQRDLA